MKLRHDVLYSLLLVVAAAVAAVFFWQTAETNTHLFLLIGSASLLSGFILRSDVRMRFFILACVLLVAATFLFERQEPVFILGDVTSSLQNTLRFDLPNLDNVLLGIPLLLISGFCFARALRPPVVVTDAQDADAVSLPIAAFLREHFVLIVCWVLLYALILIQLTHQSREGAIAGIFMVLLFLLAYLGYRFDRQAGRSLRLNISRRDWLWIGAIAVLGLGIGVYKLDSVPHTVIWDEVDFLDRGKVIAKDQEAFSFFDNGPFNMPLPSSFYLGGVFKLLGVSLWTWRFGSVLAATLALIPTYLLARAMFGRQVAILSGIFLVTMPYYLTYARMGYNNSQSLLPMALAIYFLYTAVQKKSLFYGTLGGITAGFGYYTYLGSRIAPMVGVLFMVYLLIPLLVNVIRSPLKRAALKKAAPFILITGVFAGSTIATIAPYIVFGNAVNPNDTSFRTLQNVMFLSDYARQFFPEEELYRDYPPIVVGGQTLFFRPDLYAILMTRGFVRTMLAFQIPLLPSNAFFVATALPGTLGAALYFIGLALSIARFRKPEYALLVIWFAVGIFVLAVIATDPPSHTHLVGLIPLMAIFIAISVSACVDLLAEKLPLPPRFNWKLALTGAFVIALIGAGFYDYFVRVPEKFLPDSQNIMDFYNLELAEPRSVLYITSRDWESDEWVPALTRLLDTKANFQTLILAELESGLTLASGNKYTTFFLPEDAQTVVGYLREKLRRDDIVPAVYRDINGQEILMSYEFDT